MSHKSDAAKEIVRLLPAVAINLRIAALFDLERADLTANQLLSLLLVRMAPEGRLKAGEIASRLDVSLPAATALVDRLVAAGVVTRSQGEDRRVVWITITDKGVDLLVRLGDGLQRRIEIATSESDEATLDALVEGLRRVASFADLIAPEAIATKTKPPP